MTPAKPHSSAPGSSPRVPGSRGGPRLSKSTEVESSDDPGRMKRCPQCGQHFSAEGRFCPFDRTPLVRAVDWDPTDDSTLGQTIDGRYLVEAVIGEGGMGRVYRVQHVTLGKRFALKALRRDLAEDPEIAARFTHEARTAASVTHPGLVQILDFGHLPTGQAYFVMELLDGVPLSALLRRYGALPPIRAANLVERIAEALAAVHDAGVIHRDLKPDNLHVRVLEDHDQVKIVDFGLAKVIGGTKMTREGIVFGTPYYMSPEQASGEATDQRADIYALGVLFYELLTGQVPFEADSYEGVLTQQITADPIPPSQVLAIPGQLEDLEKIVLRCLEKDPARRFQKLAELRAAFQGISPETRERLSVLKPQPRRIESVKRELDAADLAAPGRLSLRTSAALLIVSAVLGAMIAALVVTRSEHAPRGSRQESLRGANPDQKTLEAQSAAPSVSASRPEPARSAAVSAAASTARSGSQGIHAAPPAPVTRNAPRGKQRDESPSDDPLHGSEIIDPWAK